MSKKAIVLECKNCKFFVQTSKGILTGRKSGNCSHWKCRTPNDFGCTSIELKKIADCYMEILPE